MGGLQAKLSSKADIYKDQIISEWGSVHFDILSTVVSTNLKIQRLKYLFVKAYLKSTM